MLAFWRIVDPPEEWPLGRAARRSRAATAARTALAVACTVVIVGTLAAAHWMPERAENVAVAMLSRVGIDVAEDEVDASAPPVTTDLPAPTAPADVSGPPVSGTRPEGGRGTSGDAGSRSRSGGSDEVRGTPPPPPATSVPARPLPPTTTAPPASSGPPSATPAVPPNPRPAPPSLPDVMLPLPEALPMPDPMPVPPVVEPCEKKEHDKPYKHDDDKDRDRCKKQLSPPVHGEAAPDPPDAVAPPAS